MSEQKMGTHYVREVVAMFRETAAECRFPEVKEKLLALADELEPIAAKLYFKTQKGTEDMQSLTAEIGDLKGALAACTEAGAAQGFCVPFFDKLGKIIHHVKTMKVRMT
ncbi:MAG: hypothetical protein ACYDA8_02065 [Deferrisomatales bacterium]